MIALAKLTNFEFEFAFEFWDCSLLGFVSIFWTWFVGFERSSRALSKTCWFVRIPDLFEVWVCSYFFNLVCCFCGANEASEVHSETFGFVRVFWMCFVVFGLVGSSNLFLFCGLFVVSAKRTKRAKPTRRLLGLFEFWV